MELRIFLVLFGTILPCMSVDNVLHEKEMFSKTSAPQISYKTKYFTVRVDHFSFTTTDTFQLRYLVADHFWDRSGGPIFFYTGNEGDIALFCNTTGFMWEIAPEFKAMLVFAEHRYYGESLPFGQDSYKDPAHVGYLSSEQALADFAALILHIKATLPGAGTSPVVAFGGSYGGMLAAWLRMKYPHVVTGSLAASAPIWSVGTLTPCNAFQRIVTQDFKRESTVCADNIKRSWPILTEMGKTESGRQSLVQVLRLCDPVRSESDVSKVKQWLKETYGYLAMVDYPYPANFLQPLPAWPIKESCKFLSSSSLSDEELIKGLADAINVYFNYTGDTQCFNTSTTTTSALGIQGWNFQACTEIIMPMCSDGKTDMFEASPWNLTAYEADCKKQWGDIPVLPGWAEVQYGGRNITTSSNIIFSNGLLDPWSGGGVMESLSDTLVAIVIEEGAHHLDLRSSNPADPPSVIQARNQEKKIIGQWIKEAQNVKDSNRAGYHSMANVEHEKTNPVTSTNGAFVAIVVVLAVVLVGGAIAVMKRTAHVLRPADAVVNPEARNPNIPDNAYRSISLNPQSTPLLLEFDQC